MTGDDYIALVLVYLVIAVSVVLSALLEKTGKFDQNTTRKVVHIGVGNFVFIWWLFSANWIMLVFFTIPFALLLLIAAIPGNAVSKSKLGKMSSEDGHRFGLFFYAVSISIMVIFFFDHWVAASIGIVAMTYGDAFGSLVGKKYGKHKLPRNKSVEGTLAVLFSTAFFAFIIIAFYGFLISNGHYDGDYKTCIPTVFACLIAGVVTALAENLTPGEYDNITIPTLVALCMVAVGL